MDYPIHEIFKNVFQIEEMDYDEPILEKNGVFKYKGYGIKTDYVYGWVQKKSN